MNFQALRNSLPGLFIAFASAWLVAACGGGGSSGSNAGGPVFIAPQNGTFYAGIPARITLSGGRRPYFLTSSEPGILAVPSQVDAGYVDVVPNNPGVIDIGLEPGALPVRSIVVTMRDTTGITVDATIRVAQNFLTGYGLTLAPSNCPAAAGGAAALTACAGGTTVARMSATFNGSLYGNQQFRYQVIRGNFSLRNPVTGQVSDTITLTSDHTGTVIGFIEVPAGARSQIAVIRVIHLPTGVYADQVFVISQNSATAALTIIPNTFTFTGATTVDCGTGTADFLVFDGVPPYTAISTNPNVLVTPDVSNTNPGRFTLNAYNRFVCVSNATIVVTDSTGARGTVTVTTNAGSTPPPAPQPITVAPTTITVACGSSGSVSVVGGTGQYSVNSTNPNVTGVVSGNTLTIMRAGPAGPGTGSMSVVVSVTDGASVATITVTTPTTCP